MNQRHTVLGRQLYFLWVLSFITRVFDNGLDCLSRVFSIIDSRFQPIGYINSLVVQLTSYYNKVIQDSRVVNLEAGSHTFSGLRRQAILCP